MSFENFDMEIVYAQYSETLLDNLMKLNTNIKCH